jgi:hypothetical protein
LTMASHCQRAVLVMCFEKYLTERIPCLPLVEYQLICHVTFEIHTCIFTKHVFIPYIFVYSSHIGGVMTSMFAWSAVDRRFEPLSRQTKDYQRYCL